MKLEIDFNLKPDTLRLFVYTCPLATLDPGFTATQDTSANHRADQTHEASEEQVVVCWVSGHQVPPQRQLIKVGWHAKCWPLVA
jgi:hypothetical protein